MQIQIPFRNRLTSSPQPRRLVDVDTTSGGKLIFLFLLLVSMGTAFSGVRVFAFAGFQVTPAHILLAILLVVIWRFGKGSVPVAFVVICYLFVLGEIVHALLDGFADQTEWHKSFAQFVIYSSAFLLIAGLRLEHKALDVSSSILVKLGVMVGLACILQFILLNTGFPATLPDDWRVRSYEIVAASSRYGGFLPAFGFASEPSRHAVVLVLLLALIIFLERLGYIRRSSLFYWAIFLLVGGVILSFSLTGILMTTLVLAATLMTSSWRYLRTRVGITVGLIAVILSFTMVSPIQTRFEKLLSGTDNSSRVRILASTELFITPLSEAKIDAFGTGLGMEMREYLTYFRVYNSKSTLGVYREDIKIHNIFTVVRLMQGWLGFILYFTLIWNVLRPRQRGINEFVPLLAFFLAYHFATGNYLSPEYWAMMGLVVVMRKAAMEFRLYSSVVPKAHPTNFEFFPRIDDETETR